MDQLKLLEDRFTAEMNAQEKSRLREILAFRISQEARDLTDRYKKTYSAAYIDRASAYLKVVSLGYEDTPDSLVKGSLVNRLTGPWDLLGRNKRRLRRLVKNTGDRTRTLSGWVTDLSCQSNKLFPDFPDAEKTSTGTGVLAAGILGTESRNRYRRIFWLTTGQDRIDYFRMLREQGLGSTDNPLLIASMGGGTGSLGMDIQQELRERYDITSRIVIFGVMDNACELGSYFARMRGADMAWVVNKSGQDDLLALLQQRVTGKKVKEDLKATNPRGEEITIASDLEGAFHHLILNGWWEYFTDEQAAGWLAVAQQLLATEARAVVNLMRNTYQDRDGQENPIPALKALKGGGFDQEQMHFRSIKSLEKSGLVERCGFTIKDQVDGAIFPVVSLEKS